MLIHPVSDTHLDSYPDLWIPSVPACDLIVAAGDVDDDIERSIRRVSAMADGTPAVLVPGNHEWYASRPMFEREDWRAYASSWNVHLLDRHVYEIGGWRVAGCTLWTDFGSSSAAARRASDVMLDHKRIRGERNQIWTPGDAIERHEGDVAWLRETVAAGDPSRTIIVTHHPSSFQMLPDNRDSILRYAYASDREELIAELGVPLWISGHTHVSRDLQVGRTRLISNPMGYSMRPTPGYDSDLVIEV